MGRLCVDLSARVGFGNIGPMVFGLQRNANLSISLRALRLCG